jgi:arginine utilization protein RocB
VHRLDRLGAPPTERRRERTGLRAARAATLADVRAAVARSAVRGPAVVLFLFPPFYPASAPREGKLARAVRAVFERASLPVLGPYPYISDASYVAWPCEPAEDLRQLLPELGRSYHVPEAAARALDLDVVNVGPWGRGAHGLYERVHARYAFETLPGLLAACVLEAWA